jgi:AGCS family alanine or glycine:cation symporter
MVGSVLTLPIVWSLADIANALMAIPNLVALLALSGVIVAETRQHLWEPANSATMPADATVT